MHLYSPSLNVFLLTALAIGVGTGAVSAAERHAGTVLAVSPQSRVVTLDEFGANAVRKTIEVKVSPDARILISERNMGPTEFDQPFKDTPIGLEDVRSGDFVVVEAADESGGASLVQVTLRGGPAVQ